MAEPKLTRRAMLRTVAQPTSSRRLVFQPEAGPRGDVLVTIFLRGAMDGLHTVPPYGDADYRKHRPALAIEAPGKDAKCAVDLDGFYGLHPDMAPLKELFQAKRLAIIHASGSPDTTLSHFEAMQSMERGVTDGNSTASGWITRHLGSQDPDSPSPMRGVAFGDVLPKSLQGSTSVTAVRSLSEFRLSLPDDWGLGYRSILAGLYKGNDMASESGRHLMELLSKLEKLDPNTYQAEGGAAYPKSDLGRGLSQTAQLIKANVGLEVATVDLGGWDAHVAQVELMTGLMKNLSQSLHAFHADLGDHMRRVTVVAMTEFGRRVHENSSLGTDHGHASAMFVMGGGIRGGKVYGQWPGLHGDQLDQDGNLRVTTDFRDILGEIVDKRLHNSQLNAVFPDYSPRYLNLTS